jgi:hypothetical protein
MPLILGTNSIKDTGYDVANSLRFNKTGGTDDFLDIQYAADGNRKTFTISFWMKIGKLATNMYPMAIYDTSADKQADIRHSSANQLRMLATDTAGTQRLHLNTTRVFTDMSAWYHIHWQVDTTQGTDTNRVKLHVNGVQETVFSTETYPPQNTDLRWNGRNNADTGGVTRIGAIQGGTGAFDGYLAEVVFIDGTALGPTSFGEFDSDSPTIWKPIDVSGLTFGTNGFYLEFKQTGTSQNSSGFGADTSGNDNHFAVNNFTAIDKSVDTCTNNFATFNRAQKDNLTLSDGNLVGENSSTSAWNRASGTIGVTSGKWYAEFKMTTQEASQVGVIEINRASLSTTDQPRTDISCYAYKDNGQKGNNNSDSSYGDTFTDGDILGIALDLDNHKLYFSKNGTFQNSGDPTTGSTGTGSAYNLDSTYTYTFIAAVYDSSGNGKIEGNFGGTQSFTVSSGNADGNGYGNFEYAVPSGYFALCTKNLGEQGG